MSRRLIDANELISELYYYEHNEGGLTAYDAQDIINKAPTIDIVRCGECRRYMGDKYCYRELGGNAELYKRSIIFPVDADDYCSYGERRDI